MVIKKRKEHLEKQRIWRGLWKRVVFEQGLMGRLDLDTQRWTAQESTAGEPRGYCALGPGTHCLSGFPKRLTAEAVGRTSRSWGHKSFSPQGAPGGTPQHPP